VDEFLKKNDYRSDEDTICSGQDTAIDFYHTPDHRSAG